MQIKGTICTNSKVTSKILSIYSSFQSLHVVHFVLSFSIVQKVQVELEGIKKDLDKVTVKTQEVLASPKQSASAPVLRSELDVTVQRMDHAYMLSSIYLEK